MKLYQPAQVVGILACTVLASTIVLTFSPKASDVALPAPEEELQHFTAEVTAYSSSPDETWGDPFITASGREVHDGLVACPRKYPFGTRFRIGSDIYTCWDRMHIRFDHRFDIWKPSKQEALRFGRQMLTVEALETGGS
jgi:3D (Asp-Asp-Asp) domain-containing protein